MKHEPTNKASKLANVQTNERASEPSQAKPSHAKPSQDT